MKYVVGQLIMFSCVMNSAPAMETIQAIAAPQATIPGSVMARSRTVDFHDRCWKYRATISRKSAA